MSTDAKTVVSAKDRSAANQPGMATQSGSTGAAAAFEAYRKTTVFERLDGLRALAILAVIWHHAGPSLGSALQARWAIFERGFLGVDLFFVLSGFLITTLLLRERDRTGDVNFLGFSRRRALRIYPAYFLMLLLAAAGAAASGGAQAAKVWADLPHSLTFTANFVPMASMLAITWSLAVEQQFYLVMPVLEKLGRRAAAISLAVLAAVSCAIPLVLTKESGLFSTVPEFFVTTTFFPIVLGALMAHVAHERRGFAVLWRAASHPLAIPLAATMTLAACAWPGQDISGLPRLVMQLCFGVLVLVCVLTPAMPAAKADSAAGSVAGARWSFLQWAPVKRLGAVSYGMYLYHLLVMHVATKLLHVGMPALAGNAGGPGGVVAALALFAMTTVMTWAAAELSYRFFEARFLRMKAPAVQDAQRQARGAQSVTMDIGGAASAGLGRR